MPQTQFLVTLDDTTNLHTFKVSSLEELQTGLRASYPELGEFTLSYFDDEGDSIKVTSAPEFAEALNMAKDNGNFLSIILENKPAPAPQAAAPAPQRPAASPLDFLSNLMGANLAENSFVQDLLQNINAAADSDSMNGLPEAIQEAAVNFMPMIQEASKDIQPMFAEVSKEISSALEAYNCPEEVEVKAPAAPAPVAPAASPAAPAPVVHHAICDSCDAQIAGVRYKCLVCPDYDLCEACEASNLEKATHDAQHVFAKLYRPEQRVASIFRKAGGCPRRGGFGGRKRVAKLEEDVAQLQQQIAALLLKKQEENAVEEPVEMDAGEVLIEDVDPDEVCSEGVVEPLVEHEDEAPLDEATQNLLNLFRSMGFEDDAANLAIVAAHNGNVEQCLETLLNGSF